VVLELLGVGVLLDAEELEDVDDEVLLDTE
jgi:hypothetical protein